MSESCCEPSRIIVTGGGSGTPTPCVPETLTALSGFSFIAGESSAGLTGGPSTIAPDGLSFLVDLAVEDGTFTPVLPADHFLVAQIDVTLTDGSDWVPAPVGSLGLWQDLWAAFGTGPTQRWGMWTHQGGSSPTNMTFADANGKTIESVGIQIWHATDCGTGPFGPGAFAPVLSITVAEQAAGEEFIDIDTTVSVGLFSQTDLTIVGFGSLRSPVAPTITPPTGPVVPGSGVQPLTGAAGAWSGRLEINRAHSIQSGAMRVSGLGDPTVSGDNARAIAIQLAGTPQTLPPVPCDFGEDFHKSGFQSSNDLTTRFNQLMSGPLETLDVGEFATGGNVGASPGAGNAFVLVVADDGLGNPVIRYTPAVSLGGGNFGFTL